LLTEFKNIYQLPVGHNIDLHVDWMGTNTRE
jgi:hypothetical protein